MKLFTKNYNQVISNEYLHNSLSAEKTAVFILNRFSKSTINKLKLLVITKFVQALQVEQNLLTRNNTSLCNFHSGNLFFQF